MSSRLGSFARGASFLCFALSLAAEENPRFLLSAPQVMKAGWNARILKHHDLNQDGLEDLAYYNLDRSRIEFLYRTKNGKMHLSAFRSAQPDRWEPPLEDAPYVKEFLFISDELTAFAFGDLNDDGSTDLVRGSPENGLHIHFRTKDNKWSKPIEIESKTLKTHSRGDQDRREIKGLRLLNSFFLLRTDWKSCPSKRASLFIRPSFSARMPSGPTGWTCLILMKTDISIGCIPHRGPIVLYGFVMVVRMGSVRNAPSSLPSGLLSTLCPSWQERQGTPVRFSAIDRLSGEAMVFSFFEGGREGSRMGLQ